MMTARNCQG